MLALPVGVRLEIERPLDQKRVRAWLGDDGPECLAGLIALSTRLFVVANGDEDSSAGAAARDLGKVLSRNGRPVTVEYGPPVVARK